MKFIPPIKICLVAPLPPPYGGISQWTDIVYKYSKSFKPIEISVIDTSVRWRKVYQISKGKRILGGSVQTIFILFLILIKNFKDRPDVVHLTTSGSLGIVRDYFILKIYKIFRIPVVYHLHFGKIPQIATKNTNEWKILKKSFQFAHSVIVLDFNTENVIRQTLPNVPVYKIINFFDFKKRKVGKIGKIPSENKVLFLGWVIPEKGIEILIDAWTGLKENHWYLEIVGPYDPKFLKKLIEKYKFKRVQFQGALNHEDAIQTIASSSILVLPSFSEGCPNVILEGMAFGKAIIASGVGAIPELLNEECGIIIPSGDTEKLREALFTLIQRKELRVKLGNRARKKFFNSYTFEKVFPRYLAVWVSAKKSLLNKELKK